MFKPLFCHVLSSVEPCSLVRCWELRDGGQTRVSPMRQPTGWNSDYPSTLQSLDWTRGTIPCDVTSNVKSFSSKQPDVFWGAACSLFLCWDKPASSPSQPASCCICSASHHAHWHCSGFSFSHLPFVSLTQLNPFRGNSTGQCVPAH